MSTNDRPWRGVRARVVIALVLCALTTIGSRAYLRRDDSVAVKRHPNGQVAERREYRRGLEHGVHRGWYANGAVRFVYHYANGVAEGVQEDWYPDGTPYTRFEYVAGHEEGRQQMWTDKGVLRANYIVEHGRRYGSAGTAGCEGSAHDDSVTVVAERAR